MVIRLCLLLVLLASAAGARELKLELLATPGAPVIVEGEMIPVTIRGTYDSRIAREEMQIPVSDRFDWIQLARDDWHEARVDGQSRFIVERHLALFARRTGIARFGPVRHALEVIGPDSRRIATEAVAPPLELTIAPMPDVPPFTRPNGWRFAAQSLVLSDSLSTDPARLADGQTVTRTVVLRATGALPHMLPPRPVVSENWLITFAAPVEQALELTPEGPVATVTWRWQFRPETGEPGVIPAVEIPYFNTRSRRVEAVEIPALPIGYASFAAGRLRGGTLSALTRAGIAAGLLAGVVVAGLTVGRGLLGRGWRFHPAEALAWHRALRRRDLGALRRLAAARVARGEGGRAALSMLDAALFGRDAAPPDWRALARARGRRD